MLNIKTRSLVVKCRAAGEKENPINLAKKRFDNKRNVVLKDNLNKIVSIGNAELKDLNEFMKELDLLHRKEINDWFNKKDVSVSRSHVAEVVGSDDDENDENIFVSK